MTINKILIIEDEFIIANSLKKKLKEIGYLDVMIVHEYQEGIKAFENYYPDLVLMDIMLSEPDGKDGIELAKYITDNKKTPIIFITAYSGEQIQKRVLSVEPYGYLIKPINNKELEVLLQLVQKRIDLEKKLIESEKELKKFNKHLEAMVYIKTKQLLKTNKELESRLNEIDEKKKIIKQKEEKYKTLINNVPIVIYEIDEFGNLTFLNKAGKDILGYTSTDISNGLNSIAIGLLESHSELKDDHSQRKPVKRLIQTKSKGFRTMECYFSNKLNESKTKTLSGSMIDVTELEFEEIKNKKISTAIFQAKENILITDKLGKIEFVNEALVNTYGYTEKELRGKYPSIFKTGDMTNVKAEHIWDTISNGKTYSGIFINKTKAGEIIYEEKLISPVLDEKGKIISYVSTGRNITEKIQNEKKLKENQLFIEKLSENIPGILIVFDVSLNKFIFSNGQLENLLNIDIKIPEKVSFYAIRSFFNINEIKNLKSLYKNAVKQIVKHGHAEVLLKLKANLKRDVWVNFKISSIKTQEYYRLLILGIDVTSTKENEERIKALTRINLLNEKKYQRSRLFSSIHGQEEERKRISRELHDGLGQNLTLLKILISKLNDCSTLSESKVSQKDLQLINQLIKDTINETKRISYDLAPPGLTEFGLQLSLDALINRVKETTEMKIGFKTSGNVIEFKQFVTITVYRIVQELISNSIKYSDANQLDINMSYLNNTFSLVVTDNGIGIPQERIDNLYRKKISREYSGLGLLNIAERSELIGADFTISNLNGKGTRVEITFKIDQNV